MTDNERSDLRLYCAFLLKEYGFSFSPDDPVIPALYVIHKEMQLNNQKSKALGLQVEQAASKIHPVAFHFNASGEALKFQLGIVIKWIIVSVLVLVFLWTGFWFWSAKNDLKEAKELLITHNHMGDFYSRVQHDEKGNYFIDFTMAKKDSVNRFTEFKRINAKTVRVFLGNTKNKIN